MLKVKEIQLDLNINVIRRNYSTTVKVFCKDLRQYGLVCVKDR